MIAPQTKIQQRTADRALNGHPATGYWGTVLLLSGVFLCGLTYLNYHGLLPITLPRTWIIHRFAWYAFGMMAFFGGCYLLRLPQQENRTLSALSQQPKFKSLLFYTRKECHLCDNAKTLLLKYQQDLPLINEVDIDGQVELQEKFGSCVPVVEIDGKVRFRGEVNELLLRRLLENQS